MVDKNVDQNAYGAGSEGSRFQSRAAHAPAGCDLVDRAAWVPLVTPRGVELVSARVSGYEHTIDGPLVDQMSLAP